MTRPRRMTAFEKAAAIERDRQWGDMKPGDPEWSEQRKADVLFMAGYDRRGLLNELGWREPFLAAPATPEPARGRNFDPYAVRSEGAPEHRPTAQFEDGSPPVCVIDDESWPCALAPATPEPAGLREALARVAVLEERVETEWYNGNVDEPARDRILVR